MASPSMDALASFTHLQDRLPDWLSRIDSLATVVESKREEFAADYVKVLANARPKRRRTPSTTSMRAVEDTALSGCDDNGLRESDNVNAELPTTEISPLEPENRYLFANPRRAKRKQGTTMRSVSSGLNSFRNQHQVIIYYDSAVQESLETLVKEIGTARNHLRKGKQALELERGLSLNSFGFGMPGRRRRGPPGALSSPSAVVEPKTNMSPTPPDDDVGFVDVTKELESAQGLCETAAHQFLRDGDCIIELDQIRQALKEANKITSTQMKLLTPETAPSTTLNSVSPPTSTSTSTTKGSPATTTTPPSTRTTRPRPAFLDSVTPTPTSKMQPTITSTPSPFPQNSASAAISAAIEVDSDDEEDNADFVIDISRFRTQRGNGLRG